MKVGDLSEFMEAYSRGFVSEPVLYPDDGGILLHNPELCHGGPPLDWVVYVHTSPTHRQRRDQLRDTWANPDLFKLLHFRVVFLLGRPTPDDAHLQASPADGGVSGDFVLVFSVISKLSYSVLANNNHLGKFITASS